MVGFGRLGERLREFLFAMLAPQNRSKVEERLPSGAVVRSLDKLLNWCIGMMEGHTKALIEHRMFSEASQAMDTLMLLASTIKFGESRHRKLIVEKRLAWASQTTSSMISLRLGTGAS